MVAGDSAADGEASVLGAFFLAACFLCGVGDGEAGAVAAVVEVAVVPDFSAQETTNAMPIKAVIKDKTIFFIVVVNDFRMSCGRVDRKQ